MSEVIGLFEDLPEPTSVDVVLIQGKGSFKKIYSASIVDKKGTLKWKLVGWL